MTKEQFIAAIADLQLRVAKLESAKATPAPSGGYPPAQAGEVADDKLLAFEWANMQIRKDPPRWAGPSYVGQRMTDCTAEYLLSYAGFHEWKAQKGREEDPPRLNSKGKPWHESDSLTAKIARGWAARKDRVSAKKSDEDIPF